MFENYNKLINLYLITTILITTTITFLLHLIQDDDQILTDEKA